MTDTKHDFLKRSPLHIKLQVLALAVPLFFSVASALGLSTTYTDEVVDKFVGVNPDRIANRAFHYQVIPHKEDGDESLRVRLIEEITGEAAELEVIERETTFASAGHGSAGIALSGAINVVNPLTWAMGINPVEFISASSHNQITSFTYRYRGPVAEPIVGKTAREVRPLVKCDIVVEVTGTGAPYSTAMRSDEDGWISLNLNDFASQLEILGRKKSFNTNGYTLHLFPLDEKTKVDLFISVNAKGDIGIKENP